MRRMRDYRWKRLVVALASGAALAVWGSGSGPTRAQENPDLSGDWTLRVTTAVMGTTTPTVSLVQNGSSLSGQYSSEILGDAPVSGSVSGDRFEFSFDGDGSETVAMVTYSGTIGESDTLDGEIDLAGMYSGTFTGSRR